MKSIYAILFILTTGLFFFSSSAALSSSEARTIDLSSAAGIHWDFQPEGGIWKTISVPAGGWRAQGYTCDAGTYRADIPIPNDAKGKETHLCFDAVNFGAVVYAGQDTAHMHEVGRHIDGWVPFFADLTGVAIPGASLHIQVEVQGRRKFMYNGKYTVPEGATWYAGLEEGILRGIHLQVLPRVRINDIYLRTHISPDTLQPQVTVRNDSDHPVDAKLVSHITSWNKDSLKYPDIPSMSVNLLPHTSQKIDYSPIPWKAGPGSYWRPNLPYRSGYRAQLHIFDADLIVNGQTVANYQQRFGFRQFEAHKDHYELNGVRCNLRGDNQQEANFGTDAYGIRPGFGPPSADNPGWPRAVDNLLRLNFTVMRIHQIPATTYMLDVCDELGLMLVEESPLRGSEGGEDYQHGKENMLNMDRELALRDRNHPAIVIWSAANEWSEPIPDCVKVIQSVDSTRPIIADGCGDIGATYINMTHYVNGGGLPTFGAPVRKDRPYGETEDIWPNDITKKGFTWMATGVRLRRLKGDSDLRNYVLNNAFCNYVPGESNANEVLEIQVKGDKNAVIPPPLENPWQNPNIRLMQQCYHPLAVCDVQFDRINAISDAKGDWPVVNPRLETSTSVKRRIAAFNDELDGDQITIRWEVHKGSASGPRLASGKIPVTIPLGEFREKDISFHTPSSPCTLFLVLESWKYGKMQFREDKIAFNVVPKGTTMYPEGDYLLINASSGFPLELRGSQVVQSASPTNKMQIWTLKRLGDDKMSFLNDATGNVLAIPQGNAENGANITVRAPDGSPDEVWRLNDMDGVYVTFANEATGKLLDVYGASMSDGGRVVQWDANGGDNQKWQLKRYTGASGGNSAR